MLRTTDKGNPEILPLRGCCAIAAFVRDDRVVSSRGRGHGRGISGLRYSGVKTEVLRLAQDDRQRQPRGPSPPGMLRDRCVRSGRQQKALVRDGRVLFVILRPGVWPKDLGLEVLRSQNRGPSPCSGRQTKATQRSFPFGSAPQSLRSLGTTSKCKIEVLRVAQDDKKTSPREDRGLSS